MRVGEIFDPLEKREMQMPDEVIGTYRVHPVASMFPLLEGERYEELRVSMEEVGQLHPIVVQGDIVLDGRNRLRVCLQVGMDPVIEEYRGTLRPHDYILVSNLDRRQLDDDARVAVCAKIEQWLAVQRSARFKAAQGHHGAEGGRGHKKPKTLRTDSCEGFAEPKTRAAHARSTVGQIAQAAKVSHHKAAQAVAVSKAAPDLLDKVAKGEVKLREAAKEVKAREAKPKPKRKPKLFDPVRALNRALFVIRELRKEIARRRKEHNLNKEKRAWNHDATSKLELIKLLDWIEDELAKAERPPQ